MGYGLPAAIGASSAREPDGSYTPVYEVVRTLALMGAHAAGVAAIETVYPQATVQLCIVHMVRNSLNYVGWNKRKEVAADLRMVYSAATLAEAEMALLDFEQQWHEAYPSIAKSWRSNWQRIIPFFDYPPEVRRIIYTTNAIESVNMSLRKITKNRRAFPSDEALLKLFYLALNNIAKKWTMPVQNWKPVLNRFTIQFGERMPTN